MSVFNPETDCFFCDGRGYWIDDEALNDGTEEYDRVSCTECSGTGYVETKE